MMQRPAKIGEIGEGKDQLYHIKKKKTLKKNFKHMGTKSLQNQLEGEVEVSIAYGGWRRSLNVWSPMFLEDMLQLDNLVTKKNLRRSSSPTNNCMSPSTIVCCTLLRLPPAQSQNNLHLSYAVLLLVNTCISFTTSRLPSPSTAAITSGI